jgi:N4-(beta-N-acetylglucosaminyl)-L-asparaginase
MRHGMTAKEACLDALKRVARNYNNDAARLAQFDLNFYALRKDGDHAAASLWSGAMRGGQFRPSRYAVNDGGQSRLETCAFLLERRR